MKKEPQNEIDVLLRRLSKLDLAGAKEPESQHLDADELNAYAANALPAAARANYMAHLADCAQCRRIVADLAPVVAVAEQQAKTSAARQFFSKLMSPTVLRYAAPTLAAVVILVVGVVMIRRQPSQSHQMVALNERASKPAASVQPATVMNDKTSQNDKLASKEDRQVENKQYDEKRAANRDVEREQKVAARPATSDTGTAEDRPAKKPELARADTAAKAPPPSSAANTTQPVANVSGVAKSSDVVAQKSEEKTEQKKEQANERQAAAEEPSKVADQEYGRESSKLRITPSARRATAVGGAATRSEQSDRDRKKKDESTARSVGGHKFRREDGVWIDTSYDSQSTVNVSRGSEQYRALIADEPGIKSIAEELDGEIVLVWKGRAYRIK